MAQIDLAKAAKKFQTRGAAAGQDYTDGVRGAGADWAANTEGAAENYNAGVQQAITRGAFAAGVRSAGAAKYEQKALTIGAQRFPQGIAIAGPDWQKNFQPIAAAMDAVTPPPRRPRGDPGNIQRVVAFNQAARQAKVGR